MKRTKLSQRQLPNYCAAQERFNCISHAAGGVAAIVCLCLCLEKAQGIYCRVGSALYGLSLCLVYWVSAIYHGWPNGMAKRVLQVLDHCCIYALIAGTYTPILLCGFLPAAPRIGWGLLAFQWLSAGVCVILNAIDLRRFRVISMVAYILMGWSILFFLPVTLQAIGTQAFLWILLGGISYTVGAILYGIGAKRPWFHGIFHLFVLLGSGLQFWAIYRYIL